MFKSWVWMLMGVMLLAGNWMIDFGQAEDLEQTATEVLQGLDSPLASSS
jgi:hypothetical protein